MNPPVGKGRERLFLAIVTVVAALLAIAAAEIAMQVIGKPQALTSGWRAKPDVTPINQLGWRGRPIAIAPDDYVVVLIGDSQVECAICPPGETTDVLFERALRRHNTKARVITLGSQGYGTDQQYLALQEYLARYRADLVVVWMTLANDVWNNTFRTHTARRDPGPPKPSFWLEGDTLRGPTEPIDGLVHHAWWDGLKLGIIARRRFDRHEEDWAARLPPPTKGAVTAPTDAIYVDHTLDVLGEQRAHFSLWMTPRPPRVAYGIALTRALLDRMRSLAHSKSARFAVMAEDNFTSASEADAVRNAIALYRAGTTAIESEGQWFLADSRTFAAAIADLTAGFAFYHVPITLTAPRISAKDGHLNLAGTTQVLEDLAAMLTARPPP